MRVPDVLRRLDQWLLPPVGRVLGRLARGGRRVHVVRMSAIVVSLSVVLVAVYAAGRTQAPNDGLNGSVVYLGVANGASIPKYVATSDNRLQKLIADSATTAKPPQFFALVSFSAYLTPDQLATVFAGLDVRVINVIMRVPLDAQTQIIKIDASNIPEDVVRGMTATATAKAQDILDYENLLTKVNGSTAEDSALRTSYRSGAAISRAEESAYQSLCHCVYAAVVYATPNALGKLSHQGDVRTVEPTPRDQLIDRAVFRPPLPDQSDVAEPPGVPAPSPAGTPSGPVGG